MNDPYLFSAGWQVFYRDFVPFDTVYTDSDKMHMYVGRHIWYSMMYNIFFPDDFNKAFEECRKVAIEYLHGNINAIWLPSKTERILEMFEEQGILIHEKI